MEIDNPLLSHIRQPTASLNLSSGGKFWPDGAIDKFENIEVYPMTGQDELLLLNTKGVLLGSVLAEVISNCIPAIKDVWSIPKIDVDSIIIAIRCASYNNTMNVEYVCESCETGQKHSVDLIEVSEEIAVPDYEMPLTFDDLSIWFRPATFKENYQQMVDQNSKLTVMKNLARDDLTDDEKQELAKNSLIEVTRINIAALANSIDRVLISNGVTVTNKAHIQEWLLSLNRANYLLVTEAINNKNNEYQLPKRSFTCKNSECGHITELTIDFNPADFLSNGD